MNTSHLTDNASVKSGAAASRRSRPDLTGQGTSSKSRSLKVGSPTRSNVFNSSFTSGDQLNNTSMFVPEELTQTRRQLKNNEHLKEVEDAFVDECVDVEEVGKVKYCCTMAKRRIQIRWRRIAHNVYYHSLLAFLTNLAIWLTSSPIKVLPSYLWPLFFALSAISTYQFFCAGYADKPYSIYNFEQLYYQLKRKSSL